MSLSWLGQCLCKVPEDPLLCVIGLILLIALHLLFFYDLAARVGAFPKCPKVKKKKKKNRLYFASLHVVPLHYSQQIDLRSRRSWVNCLSGTSSQWDKVVNQHSVVLTTGANQVSTLTGSVHQQPARELNQTVHVWWLKKKGWHWSSNWEKKKKESWSNYFFRYKFVMISLILIFI